MTDELFPAEPATKPKRPRARAPQPETVVEAAAEVGVGALVESVQANPIAVFTDGKQYSDFYARMKAETAKHVPDVTTPKGRDAIRSLAFRVTKSKTALDKAGLGLTEEARKTIALVNASRKQMTEELDALAAEVRKPLTEWEIAEEERVQACNRLIGALKAAAVITDEDTSETVRQRGETTYDAVLDPDLFGDMLATAQDAKDAAVEALSRAYNRLKKAEDDAARLAALEAAEAERVAKAEAEAAERQAREDAEREAALQAEAEAEEERRAIAAREAELAAIEDAKREAAEAAAQAERDKLQAAHDAEREAEKAAHEAELAAAREEAARAKRLQEAEAARVAEIERKRAEAEKVERDRVAAEQAAQAKRDKDRAHRTKCKTEAKEAIMALGLSDGDAVKVVLALIGGDVPHATWAF